MRESGIIWDETTLRAFLENPHALVPGTRMVFVGLPESETEPLIDFIRSVPPSR
jgi:cytochrome c